MFIVNIGKVENEVLSDKDETFSYNALLLIFNLQNQRIHDFGNKANNLVVLTGILLGLELNFISVAFDSGHLEMASISNIVFTLSWFLNDGKSTLLSWLFLLSIFCLVISLLSSLLIMYSATGNAPFMDGTKLFHHTLEPNVDALYSVSILKSIMGINEKNYSYLSKLMFSSFIFLIIGLFLEVYLVILGI